MTRTLVEAREEVERLVKETIAWSESLERRTLDEAESGVWGRLFALGRALMTLWLLVHATRRRAAEYEHDGRIYAFRGEHRRTEVGTRFGKVLFTRPVARPKDKPRGKQDRPVDREIGLGSGFSLPVTTTIVRLCTQMAFGLACATFEDIYGWAPASRTILRMVDSVGDHARAFLEQVPAPPDDGEILVIQVDAKGAPMISSAEYRKRRQPRRREGDTNRRRVRRQRRRDVPRRRKKKGDKSKNAKMAVAGVIYTLRRLADGSLQGPLHKRVIATFAGHEALFKWLRKEADKRGYGTRRTLFLADGAKVLWRLKDDYFALAEGCLDWYHTAEKLWKCGEAVEPHNEQARAQWVAEQTRLLRKRGPGPVVANLRAALAALPKTGPGMKARRKRLHRTHLHLLGHYKNLRYDQLRRDDLDIATGVVEGAVRNVIGVRLDGPGMRWSVARAERLLLMRCILVNGQWADFVRLLAQRSAHGVLRLPARPIATVTHDAPRKKAA